MTQIKLITTIDKNGCMTEGNKFLYSLRENLSNFKLNTINKPLIFGRASYEVLDDIMSYRPHFVLSEKVTNNTDKTIYVNSIKQLIEILNASPYKEAYLIGGGAVINQFIKYNLIDELILTHVDTEIGGGLKLDLEALDLHSWNIYNKAEIPKSETNEFDYSIINYIKPKKRFY